MLNTWTWILSEHISLIPHVVSMIQVCFVLALQTVEVERGLNYHKMIKGRFRANLTVMTMDSLLRGKLLAEPFKWESRLVL